MLEAKSLEFRQGELHGDEVFCKTKLFLTLRLMPTPLRVQAPSKWPTYHHGDDADTHHQEPTTVQSSFDPATRTMTLGGKRLSNGHSIAASVVQLAEISARVASEGDFCQHFARLSCSFQ